MTQYPHNEYLGKIFIINHKAFPQGARWMQHGLTNPAVSLHQPAPVSVVGKPSASFS